ncbi:hypothetical protein C8J56DRAFT_902687 [Mycena floridula]|nr:hypothetical protein C8J56DRAFT_902687 [Mycena floridula]
MDVTKEMIKYIHGFGWVAIRSISANHSCSDERRLASWGPCMMDATKEMIMEIMKIIMTLMEPRSREDLLSRQKYLFLAFLVASTALRKTQVLTVSEFPFESRLAEYVQRGVGSKLGLNEDHSFIKASLTGSICKTQDYTFADSSRIPSDATEFDGSPDTYNWILDSGKFEVADNNLALVPSENQGAGTKLSSTRYVHYGTIKATVKTGQWNGIVLAFITMSGVGDEIDQWYRGQLFQWQIRVPLFFTSNETNLT